MTAATKRDDARGPMGPSDGPALADHHPTPDRAPVTLARQNSEAVTSACTMTRGRLSGRPFASRWSTAVENAPGKILREHRLVAQKKTAHGAPWTKEDVRELRTLRRRRR